MDTFEDFICKKALQGKYIYLHNTCSDSDLVNYHLSINDNDTFTNTNPPRVLVSSNIINETCHNNSYNFKTTLNSNFISNLSNYKLRLCTQMGSRGGRAGSGISYLSSDPLFNTADPSVNTPPGPGPGPAPGPSGSCTQGTMPKWAPNKTMSTYRILNQNCWPSMQKLQKEACTNGIRVNRIYLAFFNPTIQYTTGDGLKQEYLPEFHKNLAFNGSEKTAFDSLQDWISQMTKAGVEIYLSMGGWNYNCFPYPYMKYSVGGYGNSTPNFWKIKAFGGDTTDCNEDNQYCYVCEDKSENIDDLNTAMSIFPELDNISGAADVWNKARTYIDTNIPKGDCSGTITTPSCPTRKSLGKVLIPGTQPKVDGWPDGVTVPGYPVTKDPYGCIVQLAVDLGATGIDIDYEEMWHADMYKDVWTVSKWTPGNMKDGPWTLYETVYKYATIVKTIMLHIEGSDNKDLYISTTPGAVGGWQGKWWGGNLKGVWWWLYKLFPEIWTKLTEHDGLNVMTYDLSDDNIFHECPPSGMCDLAGQVEFYMNTMDKLPAHPTTGSKASVGFEIGEPAYPGLPDKEHRLYLKDTDLADILPGFVGRNLFYWQWGKPAGKSIKGTVEENELTSRMCINSSSQKKCQDTTFIQCDKCDPWPAASPTPASTS